MHARTFCTYMCHNERRPPRPALCSAWRVFGPCLIHVWNMQFTLVENEQKLSLVSIVRGRMETPDAATFVGENDVCPHLFYKSLQHFSHKIHENRESYKKSILANKITEFTPMPQMNIFNKHTKQNYSLASRLWYCWCSLIINFGYRTKI